MSQIISAPLLLVGSYASADQPGIYCFRFDPSAGALEPRAALAGIANPSFLTAHPNRLWFYAVSETSAEQDGAAGAVWACQLNSENGTLQPIGQQPSGGDWPCHLELDPSGRWLLASNYGSGSVSVLPILEDGSLGPMSGLIEHHGQGTNPERQAGPHAHSATFAPDGRFAIVADLGLDKLLVYALDAAAGTLSAHSYVDTRPGAGPRHLAFHPGGQWLYLANELDSTVGVYEYDGAGGALRERQTLATIPAGVSENFVADIHVAPGGGRLYVSNRGHDSIAVFEIMADGRLIERAVRPCGGSWSRNFALAPGGFMIAANQYSDEIAVLPLLGDPQAVGSPVARAAVPRASCVRFV
jgi:6-phosphogluconolactonase